MVVTAGATFMLVPLPSAVPPQLPEYHFHTAPVPSEPPLNVISDESPAQILEGVAVADTGATEDILVFKVRLAHTEFPAQPSARTK